MTHTGMYNKELLQLFCKGRTDYTLCVLHLYKIKLKTLFIAVFL